MSKSKNVSKATAAAVASIPGLVPSQSATQTLADQLKALQEENARLKAQAVGTSRLYAKVSEKGAVSLYGMGRFPVTLYREQWERVKAEGIAVVDACIEQHKAQLEAVGKAHLARKEAERMAKATAAPATGKAEALTAF